MTNGFQIQLKVRNIGPHCEDRAIEFKDIVDSNKAAFYALNGTGKTFISRAIRLSEIVPEDYDATKLLSFGTAEGSLSFDVIANNQPKSLEINIGSGANPTVRNTLGLIFHVFNSDFIEENVKSKGYTPDGNIDGYILGKSQIDISDERAAEKNLEAEIRSISDKIDNLIAEAKKCLQEEGVQATTAEMRLITRDKVNAAELQDVTDSFEQIVEKLKTLKSVPENLADVSCPSYATSEGLLNDIVNLLTTEFPQSSWDEEFVSAFQKKRSFIETGLEHSHDDKACPFCGRPYDGDSLELIRNYRAFLADKHAQIHNRISNCKDCIQTFRLRIDDFIASNKSSAGELSEVSRFFPSLQKEKIVIPNVDPEFLAVLSEIEKLLDKKTDNITVAFAVDDSWESLWTSNEVTFANIVKNNEETVKRVNRTKNDANGERLTLRRNLCKAKYNELVNICGELYSALSEKNEELKKLQESIRSKEQQVKVSKKEKILETLTYLLNQFFYDKYTINEKTFEIQFHGKDLGKNVGNVLSDGEKGIVAFCWYLSYVHQLIDKEDDYEKLFFVIDDPVSSMDFNYVYAVAQTLREIKTLFNIKTHERIWVFTHNLEFLSIIARNHVLPRVYLLSPGGIEEYDYKLLMPYESHLHDVVCIAEGIIPPSHTTGNSIRHIIETIAKFENPQIGLENYIQSNKLLSANSAIYSLCQDLSHGSMRSEQPYTPENMRNACQTVKEFVNNKYPDQIDSVKR